MRRDLTMIQVAAVRDHLQAVLGEEPDERLVIDTLEGETDAIELIKRLLNGLEEDEGNKAALVSQIQDRNERKARAERRIDGRREAIMALMECAGLDKLPLPEASLSIRKVSPKPKVIDEAALPDAVCRIIRKPNMALIKTAIEVGGLPAGVMLDNGGMSLTVRRK